MPENEPRQTPLCPVCGQPLQKVDIARESFGGEKIALERWECPQCGPLPPSGTRVTKQR